MFRGSAPYNNKRPRQRSAAKAGGRVRIGDALGGTMMRIARRVHLCMGPLRASAGLLVTFGHKSNMQRIIMRDVVSNVLNK